MQPVRVPPGSADKLANVTGFGPGRLVLPADGTVLQSRDGVAGNGTVGSPYRLDGEAFNFLVMDSKPANPTFRVFAIISTRNPANGFNDYRIRELIQGAPIMLDPGANRVWVWYSSLAAAGQTVTLYVLNGEVLDLKGTVGSPLYFRAQPNTGGFNGEIQLAEGMLAAAGIISVDAANRDMHQLLWSARGNAGFRFSAFGLASLTMPYLEPDPSRLYQVEGIVGNTAGFLWDGQPGSGQTTTISWQLLGRFS